MLRSRLSFQASKSKILPVPLSSLSNRPFSTVPDDPALVAGFGNSPCPVLQRALPRLRQKFEDVTSKTTKEGGVPAWPLLSPEHHEKMLQKWNPAHYPDKRAAVLIALYSDNGTPSLLLTRRSPLVPIEPSLVSFPGGHVSHEKERLEDAALRETQEELMGNYPWADEQHLVMLGQGTTLPATTGTPVTPMIAVMMKEFQGEHLSECFPGDRSEVEVVFGMPLQELINTEHTHQLPEHPLLEKATIGPRYPSPHGPIWGLTAFMIRPLLHNLFQPAFQLKCKS